MKNNDSKTVAEFVTKNIKTADVFKKHGIDFCCGGGVTIKEACKKNAVDFDTLITELNLVESTNSFLNDYNKWELDFLIDFIQNTHHKYVDENLTLLKEYVDKVAQAHSDNHPEIFEIQELIHVVSDELTTHMKKEELLLFPFIKKLVRAKREHSKIEKPYFDSVNNPIQMMEEDHDHAGDIFKRISKLTNAYQTPEDACNTFKALYAKLKEFEDDLYQHVHLENNILFPKARYIESRL